MTQNEAIEIITNAIQTGDLTRERDIALSIVQKSVQKAINEKNTKKYVVVCYSVHECGIASVDVFTNRDEALTFLIDDANAICNEENENNEDEEFATIEIDGDTAIVRTRDEYIWTWEIISV